MGYDEIFNYIVYTVFPTNVTTFLTERIFSWRNINEKIPTRKLHACNISSNNCASIV